MLIDFSTDLQTSDNLDSIHFSATPFDAFDSEFFETDDVFISTKRVAFQSLLQKFRKPSIRPRSNRISRPCVARLANVNLKASVPKEGMPLGNCFRVACAICFAIFGCIKPAVRFSISASRSIPSIRSSGSRTFPFDLDIFWPSESRTSPCT